MAVLGATGYTGRLVCEEARRLGLPLTLVGRRRDALERLARAGEELRVADARDESSLRQAFAGAAVVASCAGPFARLGPAVVRSAIAVGAHYVDTNAEQPFARLVYERLGDDAARAGVTLLTAFGFDYVGGDLAARVAVEGLDELEEVVVAYSTPGFLPSRGTRRTAAEMLRQPLVAYADGGLVASRLGATTRRVRFPSGEAAAVEWGTTEPLTVPRYANVRNVRAYVRAPRAAAVLARAARMAAPVVALSGRVGPAGPSARRRDKGRFEVVAEARGASRGRRASLVGRDVYGVTARLIARGALGLRAGEAPAAGALAPTEAFPPAVLADWLSPLGRVDAVEGL